MDIVQLLRTLADDESPRRSELVELLVEHQFAQPVATYITEAELKRLCLAALGPDTLNTLFDHHITPGVLRCLDTMADSGALLGLWVDPSVRARWVALITRPDGPRYPYLAGALPPSLLRQLLSPVFQDVLLAFVAQLSAAVGAAGGRALESGLLQRVGREVSDRSKRWAEVGRSLLGGLGLEERLRALARDFSYQAVVTFRERLTARLQTAEGQALIRQVLDHAVDQLLSTPLSNLRDDIGRLPPADLLALCPPEVRHATSQPLFDQLLSEEISAFFTDHGQTPLGTFLDSFGLREPIRAQVRAASERHMRSLFSSPEFAAWFKAWLSDGSGT